MVAVVEHADRVKRVVGNLGIGRCPKVVKVTTNARPAIPRVKIVSRGDL